MDTAIAGLIGVAVGGIVTGGVQAITQYAGRRLGSRTAARLLYDNLLDAITLLTVRIEINDWGPEETDWTALPTA